MIKRLKPDYEYKEVRLCYKENGTGEIKEIKKCIVLKNGKRTKDFFYIDELGDDPGLSAAEIATLAPCEDDPQLIHKTVWICDNSTGVPGVKEQIWDNNAVGGNKSSEPIEVGFTKLDACKLPAHENLPETTQVLTKYQSTNINPNPPDNTPDQHILESYIKAPVAAMYGLRAGGIHAGAAAIGNCVGKLREGVRYQNSTPLEIVGSATAGFVHIKSWVHDPTQNGSHTLRYSTNGGQTWADVPDSWKFVTPPTVQEVEALYNVNECKYYRLDDKTEIVETADIEILCYNPCKADIELNLPSPLDVNVVKSKHKNLGSETLKFDDQTAGQLTIPADAVYASVELLSGDACYSFDGNKPVVGESKTISECDILPVGCSPHCVGAIEDLANFRILSKEDTLIAVVCYYGEA